MSQTEMNKGPGIATPAFSVKKTNEGTGPVCPPHSHVKVEYTGKLENGDIFDSSSYYGKPLEFVVGAGQVIKCWDKGIV